MGRKDFSNGLIIFRTACIRRKQEFLPLKGFYCICISLVLFSCSPNKIPNDILPPEKMEKLLWEQMRADAFTGEFISKDSSKNLKVENIKIQQKIFAKYKVTQKTFNKSYAYYLQHDNMMKAILDSIISKEARIREEEKAKDTLKTER